MSVNDETVIRNRRPKESKFKQQSLPAWQPILTAGTVLPTFFVIGIAFIPIGVGLLYFSNKVHEVSLDYTDCLNTLELNNQKPCHSIVEADPDADCQCIEQLNITGTEDWEGKVFIYYGLQNFYQNHRRYVKSRDDTQLLGDLTAKSDECVPFLYPNENDTSKFYVPCGAIANSLFSDDIFLEYKKKSDGEDAYKQVQVSRLNIAWESDKGHKFKNPVVPEGKTLEQVFKDSGAVKPRDWRKNLWELDLENPENNGLQNEDLIVWMRAAALPNFRKLYRRIDHTNELKKENFDANFQNGLPVVDYDYRLRINYRFRVKKFKGNKSVTISTTSLLGGKNPFLGIAYIVVGILCIILGVVFLVIHLRFGKPTQAMLNINPRTSYH